MMNITTDLTLLDSGYYIMVFIAFLYISANPFIYAAKFQPVKRVLARMIRCGKSPPDGDSVEISTTRTHTVQENKF